MLIAIVIVTVVVLKRKRVICASNVNKPEKSADAESAKSPNNKEYVEVPQTDSNQNDTT